jgi:glycosyltransferase involved in cell wall biosynthesis
VALQLAEGLRSRGYEAETWFLYRKRAAFDNEPGLQVVVESRSAMAKLPFALLSRLWQWRPDALISHTHYANVISQLLAWVCGVRVRVAVQHNPVSTYPPLVRFLDRILGSTGVYTHVAVVSHSAAASMQTYPATYRRKITVIPNAVPTPRSPEEPTSIDLPQPYVVNVGRLHFQKNQELLVRMLHEVPSVHLVILGEGELRDELANLAASLGVTDRLHLLGELPWDSAIQIVRRATLFVFPSHYEGMPLALLEAMNLGLPIVASDIPSVREVLGDSGILISTQSVTEIANSVTGLLSNPERRGLLGARALERSKDFSPERVTDAYEHLLREHDDDAVA